MRAKTAQLATAHGASADAHALLFNNPQLSADQTRRQVPQSRRGDERRREWGAGVSQSIETGGQRRFRWQATDTALTALRHEIADTQRKSVAKWPPSFTGFSRCNIGWNWKRRH